MKKLSNDEVTAASQVFRMLGDGSRLRLLLLLQGKERNVTELCEGLGMPQPTVSHHLSLLRMSGLVINRRSGKQVYYSLNEDSLVTIKKVLEVLPGK